MAEQTTGQNVAPEIPKSNTPVQESAKIKRQAGDAASTWDELESAGVNVPADKIIKKLKSNKNNAVKKETPQSADKPKQTTEKAEASEEIQETAKKESPEAAEQEVKQELKETDGEKSVDTEEAERKLLKVKRGESTYDIPEDGVVEVKVDGKTQEVPIAELRNNYSGRKHLQEQYESFKTERETFTQDRNDLQSALDTAHDLLVTKGDLKGFVVYAAELMGTDPVQVWREMKSSLPKVGDGMDEASQKALDLEDELDLYKRREETAKRRAESQKVQEDFQTRKTKVQETQKISDEQYERLKGELFKTGRFSEDDLTPELVGEYAFQLSASTKAHLALKNTNVDPGIMETAFKELNEVILKNPDLSDDDIKAIALEVYGNEPSKRLARKVKKIKETQASPEPPKIKPQNQPLFFSDL